MSVWGSRLEHRSKEQFRPNGPACESAGEVSAQVGTPAPANTAEAVDMVLAGLRHLATTDPTALAAAAQAECLHGLERADAIATAARARILATFSASQGYAEDADYSPTSWLIHR